VLNLRTIHNAGITFWATAYLVLPVILFWLFYIGGISGWLVGLSFFFGTIVLSRLNTLDNSAPNTQPVLWSQRLSAAGAATVVIAVMGFFLDVYAWDWHKHWALIGLLKDKPWPAHTTLNGEQLYLRFYMAAYIVPAAISAKLHTPLALTTGAWFWLGCYLFFHLLGSPNFDSDFKLKKYTVIIALVTPFLFICIGGADLLITRLYYGPLPFGLHSEWWASQFLGIDWQYTSPLGALSWVPHQAIAALITVALFFRVKSLPSLLAAYTALSMWSPLVMIGLLPILLVQVMRYRVELLYPYWRIVLISGLLLIVPILAAARFLSSELPAIGLGGIDISIMAHQLASAPFFVASELILVWGCLGHKVWQDPLLRTSLCILLVLPLISDGNPPDFVMRASIGPLGLLFYAAVKELPKQLLIGSWSKKLIVFISFLIVLPTALNESAFHLQAGKTYRDLSRKDIIANHDLYFNFASRPPITVNEFFDTCGWRYLPQYFARSPAFITSK
jgi:hypothetical protein